MVARWGEDGRFVMSTLAHDNLKIERTRKDFREDAVQADSRKSPATDDSRANPAPDESREKTIRGDSRNKPALHDARRHKTRRKSLRKLSDRELLSRLESLHGTERELQLTILYHLAEIDRRRLYLKTGKVIRDRIKPVFVMKPDTSRSAAVPAGDMAKSAGESAGNKNTGSDVGTKYKARLTSTPNVGSGKFPNCGNTPADPVEPERIIIQENFKIEFSVNSEFLSKLQRVRSLLSTKHPKGIGLEELFEIALDEYLNHHSPESRIKKRKRRREKNNREHTEMIRNKQDKGKKDVPVKNRSRTGRNRHIPQEARDQVFVRDGGRCTFVGTNGRRCEETEHLQIDHIKPYAKGGTSSPENLRLLCFKHNQLEAVREYGPDHMMKFARRE